MQQHNAEQPISSLPQHVMDQILGPDNLPDPIDLARFRVASIAMRDVVTATGREVHELDTSSSETSPFCSDWIGNLAMTGAGCASVTHGQLEVLKWAHAKGYPLDVHKLCHVAARDGQLDAMKWLRAKGCEWNEKTSKIAAMCGHLETLKWMHANGCPWDKDTCVGAVWGGHPELLKWLRENRCPWYWRTRTQVAKLGYVEHEPRYIEDDEDESDGEFNLRLDENLGYDSGASADEYLGGYGTALAHLRKYFDE